MIENVGNNGRPYKNNYFGFILLFFIIYSINYYFSNYIFIK